MTPYYYINDKYAFFCVNDNVWQAGWHENIFS